MCFPLFGRTEGTTGGSEAKILWMIDWRQGTRNGRILRKKHVAHKTFWSRQRAHTYGEAGEVAFGAGLLCCDSFTGARERGLTLRLERRGARPDVKNTEGMPCEPRLRELLRGLTSNSIHKSIFCFCVFWYPPTIHGNATASIPNTCRCRCRWHSVYCVLERDRCRHRKFFECMSTYEADGREHYERYKGLRHTKTLRSG